MSILESHSAFHSAKFIEVIGLPAAGKSTMVREMIRQNPDMINVNELLPKSKIARQLSKVNCLLRLLVSHPRGVLGDLRIILSSKQPSLRDYFIVGLNWVAVTYSYDKYEQDSNDRIYVWDQGVFMAIWSIYFGAKAPFDADALVKTKPLSRVIYVIDADDQTLTQRALNRGGDPRMNYTNSNHVKKGRVALEKTMSLIKRLGYSKRDVEQ